MESNELKHRPIGFGKKSQISKDNLADGQVSKIGNQDQFDWDVPAFISRLKLSIINIDLRGTITFINQFGAKYFDMTPAEIIGKKIQSLFDTRLERHRIRFEEVFTSKTGCTFVDSATLLGDKCWFSADLQPMLNQNGDIEGIQIIAMDITEKKRAEKSFIESNVKYRSLFNSIGDAIFITDKALKIVATNPAFGHLFGYSEDELYNQSVGKLFLDENFFHTVERDLKAKHHRTTLINEVEWVKKGQSSFWGEFHLFFLNPKQGSSTGVMGVVRDLTPQKMAEKELRLGKEIAKKAEKLAKIGFYEYDLTKDQWTNTKGLDDLFGIDSTFPRNASGWLQLVHPDHREMMGHYLVNHVVKEGNTFDKEYKIMNAMTQEVKWVHGRGDLKFGADNLPHSMIGTIQDITDRVESEIERLQLLKKTEENEKWFRAMTNQSADGIAVCDRKGRFQFVNPAFSQMIGFESQALLNMSLDDLTPQENCAIRNIFSKEPISIQPTQCVFRRENGTEFISEVMHSLIKINEQKLYLLTIRDITERVEKEEEIRIFRTISNVAQQGHAITDLQDKLIYVNEYFADIHGMKTEETLHKNLREFHSSRQIPILEGLIVQLNVDGSFPLQEVWHRHQYGHAFPMLMAGILLKDKDGKAKFKAYTAIDISERKEAEKKLRESEEYFRTLIEEASDVVAILDENGRFLYESPSQRRVLGFEKGELIGSNAFLRIHPDDLHPAKEGFSNLLNTPDQVIPFNFRYRHFDENWLFLQGTARNMLDHEKICGVVLNYRDVTERELANQEKADLEKRLRHSQKLETIGTLAGGIAHDFNNMLAPIMGFTELVKLKLEPTDPIFTDLDAVLNAAHRAKDLVQQILLFSKQSEKPFSPLQIKPLILEVLRLLRPSIPRTIDIQCQLSDDCGLIKGDTVQIHQVLVNLCTNAYQAMEKTGGTLTIDLHQDHLYHRQFESLTNLPEGEYAVLRVSDTGPGMEESILDRIFEPFYTTKSVEEGTGLGLSVVHGIVRSHKGEILVRSFPGQGTRFTIYLPIVSGGESPSNEKVSRDIPTGHQSILIVDDEPAIVRLTSSMVQRFGYQPYGFTTPLEALEALGKNPNQFDLIITDLTMPQMTGLKMIEEVRKLNADIPVIVMTGYGDSLTPTIQKQLGIQMVLGKPVPVKKLLESIAKGLAT